MLKRLPLKICSACLLGIKCRYDGKSQANEKVLLLAKKEVLIPICPEQLGGLPTKRECSERLGDKIFHKSGKDVTENFLLGAEQTLEIAKIFGCKEAILKQKSPSCGCGKIYDGSFSGKIVKGDGITAEVLKKNGIKIIAEDDL